MLKQRIITAVILIPLVLSSIFWLPELYFALIIGLAILAGAWEWLSLSGIAHRWVKFGFMVLLCLAFWFFYHNPMVSGLIYMVAVLWAGAIAAIVCFPTSAILWRKPGLNYSIAFIVLLTAWLSITVIKSSLDGQWYLLLLLLAIWGADVGAYFFGRAYGNKKLAPKVSPGKSWAGVYGGLGCASAVTLIWGLLMQLPVNNMVYWLLAMFLVIIISIVGDLTESMLKRTYDAKDSGRSLPGHGGVLDRIDSLLAASPVFAALILISATPG